MALPERLFHQQGVRSVVIHPYSASVLPGATARVWLTIDNLGERDLIALQDQLTEVSNNAIHGNNGALPLVSPAPDLKCYRRGH